MDLQLAGRVALVTGASRGIGRAIAQALAREGAAVMLCARNRDDLEDAVTQTASVGAADGFSADVSVPGQAEAAVERTVQRFGTIGVLVNNAGGGTGTQGDFDALDDGDWLAAYQLNVMSAVRACRAALPHMRAGRWGRIINISSENAAHPGSLVPHYGAAKAALTNFTKSLSETLAGSGVLVNVVSPAFIMTPGLGRLLAEVAGRELSAVEAEELLHTLRPHNTVGRIGRPEDIAAAVAFLASDAASFITGTNLRVDAGSVATIA
jgi:NAD(P)-dependent dehydrogenase (short-subunit alcohol dehydrogenase family)